MRDIPLPGPAISARDAAPTTSAATPQDFLVEELRSKLQAASVRERELHQHLLHHMQEKDLLVNQVAELKRVCEALLLSQMQGVNGPAAEAATAAATTSLSLVNVASNTQSNENAVAGNDSASNDPAEDTTGASATAAVNVDPRAPRDAVEPERASLAGGETKADTTAGAGRPAARQAHATSSSLEAIMGAVASAPGPKPAPVLAQPEGPGVSVSPVGGAALRGSSSRALKSALGVAGGPTSVPGSGDGAAAAASAAAAAAVHGRAVGTDPTVDIPQLLVERGGRIRITALWEAYQNRFGETPYTLKDLFSMVKAGAIPFVVHEPPAGIRLLPSAPVYQQRLQQQQLQHLQQQLRRQQQQQQHQQQQLLQQQRQAAAQAALQSYLAQVDSAVSPIFGATGGGGGGGGADSVGHNRHHHQQLQQQQQQQQQRQQQQHSFSLPSPLANAQSLPGPQPSLESANAGGSGSASDENISLGWTSGEPSSASPGPAWQRPGDPAVPMADGTSEAHSADSSDIAEAAEAPPGNSGGRGGDDEADGDRLASGPSGGTPPAPAADRNPEASGPDGGASSSGSEQKRVDWKELNRNLNLLLKEEGEMNGRDLNHAFQLRFGKSPFLNGTPVRYAVSAGWLKGVCFDVSNNTFNLAVRVPVQRREDPPEGARPYPPGSHPHPSPAPRKVVPRRDPPAPPAPSNTSSDDVDWKQLSIEFRQLLSPGALEPMEIHASYHHTFKKPLIIGVGYSMRRAVMDGRLGGITFERGSRRLMCA